MRSDLSFRLFYAALGLALALLIPYEYYWRVVEHYPCSQDLESLDMWADERSKVKYLDESDVIILGSSRAHFDINIYLWEQITGKRPLMLAYPGSSPYFPVADIVNKSDFDGLLIVGVSPGLFFTMANSWGAGRGKAFVDQYYDRTYAEKFNQFIFKRIDPLMAYTDPSINLEALVDWMPFPNRDSVPDPDIWPPMVSMDWHRNVRMTDRFEIDTVLQRRQTDIWFPEGEVRKNRFRDSIDVIMSYYVDLAEKFQDKGGRLVFIRPPVTGKYFETEPELFPREEYWDRLIQESGALGLHYMDHPDTKDLDPPEWSHLNKEDSDIYTRTVIDQLIENDLIER